MNVNPKRFLSDLHALRQIGASGVGKELCALHFRKWMSLHGIGYA